MRTPAVRSQLLRLREDLRTARDGRELLDRKREAILRALTDAIARRNAVYTDLVERLRTARSQLRLAQLHLGRGAIDAAALAQPPAPPFEVAESSVVGIRVPHFERAPLVFHPHYAPSSGSPLLDEAGAAWTRVVTVVIKFAEADITVRRLKDALARTARRLNALDRDIIPAMRSDLRVLTATLEEDERDDAVRRKQWLTKSV